MLSMSLSLPSGQTAILHRQTRSHLRQTCPPRTVHELRPRCLPQSDQTDAPSANGTGLKPGDEVSGTAYPSLPANNQWGRAAYTPIGLTTKADGVTVFPVSPVIKVGNPLGQAYFILAALHLAVALLAMCGGRAISHVLFGSLWDSSTLPLTLLAAAGASFLPVACATAVLQFAARPQGLGRHIFEACSLVLLLHGGLGMWLLVAALSLRGQAWLLGTLGILFSASILCSVLGLAQAGRARTPAMSAPQLLLYRAVRTGATLLQASYWARLFKSPSAIAHAVVSLTLLASGILLHGAYPGSEAVPLLVPADVLGTFLYRLTGHGLVAASCAGAYVVHLLSAPRARSEDSDSEDDVAVDDDCLCDPQHIAEAAVMFCSSIECISAGLDGGGDGGGDGDGADGVGGSRQFRQESPNVGPMSPYVTPGLDVGIEGLQAYLDLAVFLRVGLGGMMGTHFVLMLLAACRNVLWSNPFVLWAMASQLAGAALCAHYCRTVLMSASLMMATP